MPFYHLPWTSYPRIKHELDAAILGRVFGVGGSNGIISGSIKSKTSAGRHLEFHETGNSTTQSADPESPTPG